MYLYKINKEILTMLFRLFIKTYGEYKLLKIIVNFFGIEKIRKHIS